MIEVDFTYQNLKYSVKINNTDTIQSLKKQILEKTQIPLEQQRIEFMKGDEKIILKNDQQKLQQVFKEVNQVDVKVKNLGKQITYENLFYLEYAVPLFLWIFFYFFQFNKMNSFKTLLFLLVVIHYSKRLFESKYIHIFSNATAPLINATKNFFFYWVIFGTFAAIEILYSKSYEHKKSCVMCTLYHSVLVMIFLFAELFNLFCHIKLRQLRTDSAFGEASKIDNTRKVPKGLFFDSVISPNYSFEILAWLSFVILSKSIWVALFITCGAGIMYKWGCDKKRKLLQLKNISERDLNEVKRRKILIPSIL